MIAESNTESVVAPIKAIRARVRNIVERMDYSDTWALRFNDQKIIYVPIPKAANSSIRYALLPLAGLDETQVEHIQRFGGFDKIRFSTAVASITDEWFVFSVVRNPYARFVSAYLNKVKARPQVFPAFAAMGVSHHSSLEAFARIAQRWPRELLNDHLMPQSMLLSQAMKLPGLKVYRVEDLATEWPEISRIITQQSGKAIGPLGRANASSEGPHWRSLLTPEVRRIINRLYAADFSAFGYQVEEA